MAGVKIKQADLTREITAQDRKDSRKKFHNINALRLMLDAAKDVKDTSSFANSFTPTRGNNAIARKLKLGLDVVRGQWVLKDGKHNPGLNRITRESTMTQVNEAVEGSKLIELLMQALDEGDTVGAMELTNQLLAHKVSECLADRRKLIAEQMFIEDLADLVKTSNLDRDADSDAPDQENEPLPNAELAATASEDDEMVIGEGFEVGDRVEVKVDNGKFKKGTVTKVGRLRTRGRTRNEGVWVKVGGKTEQWPIGVVRKLKEGSEPRLDTFRQRSTSR